MRRKLGGLAVKRQSARLVLRMDQARQTPSGLAQSLRPRSLGVFGFGARQKPGAAPFLGLVEHRQQPDFSALARPTPESVERLLDEAAVQRREVEIAPGGLKLRRSQPQRARRRADGRSFIPGARGGRSGAGRRDEGRPRLIRRESVA